MSNSTDDIPFYEEEDEIIAPYNESDDDTFNPDETYEDELVIIYIPFPTYPDGDGFAVEVGTIVP